MTELAAKGIYKTFFAHGKHVQALKGIDISIGWHEAVGVVGESGSGKSTLVKILTLLERPDKGAVLSDSTELKSWQDARKNGFQKIAQVVFQESFDSLNPRMKIIGLVKEGLDIWRVGKKTGRIKRAERVLSDLGIGSEHWEKYPHELSGGQRQRVAIARALALEPKILIADEPTSALDTSVQAEIIKILIDLKNKGMGILVVSHDLRVVRKIADRCHVMLAGLIVESGPAELIFNKPLHPYTKELIRSIPTLEGVESTTSELKPLEEFGCPYKTRCAVAIDICRDVLPEIKTAANSRLVRCHVVNK